MRVVCTLPSTCRCSSRSLVREDSTGPCNDGKVHHYLPETPPNSETQSFGLGWAMPSAGKKCCFCTPRPFRLATAEHMFVLRLTRESTGQQFHVTAAFPSACGYAGRSPRSSAASVTPHRAWMRPGPDTVCAPSLEAGGRRPRHLLQDNPMAMENGTIRVALTDDENAGRHDGDVVLGT